MAFPARVAIIWLEVPACRPASLRGSRIKPGEPPFLFGKMVSSFIGKRWPAADALADALADVRAPPPRRRPPTVADDLSPTPSRQRPRPALTAIATTTATSEISGDASSTLADALTDVRPRCQTSVDGSRARARRGTRAPVERAHVGDAHVSKSMRCLSAS